MTVHDPRSQPNDTHWIANVSRRRFLQATGAVAAAGVLGPGTATADDAEFEDLCEAVETDICIVLDVSFSMDFGDGSQTRMESAQQGAKALVDMLGESDQASLVTFGLLADRETDLTTMDGSGRAALKDAIDNFSLEQRGATNLQGGIIYGAEELTGDEDLFDRADTEPSSNARDDAEKVMIVLSDGQPTTYFVETGGIGPSNDAEDEASDAAQRVKDEDIRILTITVGEAEPDFMEGIASSPDDAFVDEDLDDLEGVFTEIGEDICPTEVELSIKPEDDPNPINPCSRGKIPVAVLTTDDFDATTIDPATVRFGSPAQIKNGGGATVAHGGGHVEDVDGNGSNDWLAHFPTPDTGFEGDETEGWLAGRTVDGRSVAGRDSVRIVGCGDGGNGKGKSGKGNGKGRGQNRKGNGRR